MASSAAQPAAGSRHHALGPWSQARPIGRMRVHLHVQFHHDRQQAARQRLAGVPTRVVGRQARSESAPWRAGGVCAPRASATSSARSGADSGNADRSAARTAYWPGRCPLPGPARGARVADPGSRCRWLAGPAPGRFEAPAWRAGGSRGRRGAAPRCATDARPPTTPPRAGRAPDATRRRHVAVAAPGRKPLSFAPVRHATPRPRGPLPSAPAGRSGAPSATLRLRPPAGRRAAARLPPG